jgi:hypothetical protein
MLMIREKVLVLLLHLMALEFLENTIVIKLMESVKVYSLKTRTTGDNGKITKGKGMEHRIF